MNIKEQVLSIAQVQELQELGFDVEKYASMCWLAYTSDIPPYEKNYNLCTHDIYCYESSSLEPIPTLSIGDIIEVLPERIEEDYYLEMSKNHVDYCDDHVSLNGYIEFTLIDALFEMLKWCIKEKHMELKQTNLENRFFSEEEFNEILDKAINAMEKYSK